MIKTTYVQWCNIRKHNRNAFLEPLNDCHHQVKHIATKTICFPFDYHYCATCPTRIRLNTLLGPPIETQSTSWAKSICFALLIILIPLGPNFGIWLEKVKKIKISNLWHFWKIIVTQPFLIYPGLLFLCVSTSSIFFKKWSFVKTTKITSSQCTINPYYCDLKIKLMPIKFKVELQLWT